MIDFDAMIAEADAAVTSHAAADLVGPDARDGKRMVDIRDIRELWREGTIPGATHAPRGMLEFWFHPDSPYFKPAFGQKDIEYVLFCASGWRSALAAAALQAMGVGNVSHMAGGFSAWRAADGAVEPVAKR